ncbi:MAG: aspartate aminotransferase [Opitutus sp.]|nr:aspartate aminotransferase [Opitutus sp.]
MRFDFDHPIDRRASDSRKWNRYGGRDILPLWVADMDFAAPPVVVDALRARVEHGVFGYGYETRGLKEATVDYVARRYGWKIDEAWLVWLPGLVCGLNVAAAAIGEAGDEILCATPVYPPFMSAPTNQRRRTVTAPMVRRGGRWELDFDALERAVTPRTQQFFLCSPHNPVGRAFSRAELEQVAAFCERHNLVLVSDEIHCDLVLDAIAHVPAATLSPAVAARTITLMAPSKTFNVPGLGCSFAVIPHAELRTKFARATQGIVPDVNVLGYIACEAAMRHGEPWRQELLAYLRGNRDLIEQTVARGELPGLTMTHIEATYLAWLNIEPLKLTHAAAFFEQHGLGFSDGAPFGAAKNTHLRLNFGCTRATLIEALARLRRALAAAAR